jgi:D-threo-aldose 1-dehydrogenase
MGSTGSNGPAQTTAAAVSFRQYVRSYLLCRNGRTIAYGMGCAWLGRSQDPAAIRADLQTLEAAYEAGYRYFDTSARYGDSELRLGHLVARVPRRTIFIATKAGIPPELPPDAAANVVRESLARSLERLRTDYLDLFQIHDVDTLDQVFAENGVLGILGEARRQRVIRFYGLATRGHALLEAATRRGGFDTILTYKDYNAVDQSAAQLIALAHERGVGVINASPLSSGLLAAPDPRMTPVPVHRDLARRRERAIQLHALCRRFNVPLLAVALQFPLRNAAIDITLTGPASAAEVATGIQALEATVPPALWEEWEEMLRTMRETSIPAQAPPDSSVVG